MILTLEFDPTSTEAALCFDDEGLAYLVEKLLRLQGKRDHTHLMTPSWGGDELTEDIQGDDNVVLINHLRLVKL